MFRWHMVQCILKLHFICYISHKYQLDIYRQILKLNLAYCHNSEIINQLAHTIGVQMEKPIPNEFTLTLDFHNSNYIAYWKEV